MVDNPKTFIAIICFVIIAIVILIGGFRFLQTYQATHTNTVVNTASSTPATGTISKTTQPSSVKNIGPNSPATYDAVITYTDEGFSPFTLKIKAGSSVRFLNKSHNTMRVASPEQNSAFNFPAFSQSTSVGYNGHFDLNFNQKGVWLYENLNNKTKTGTVVVE